MKVAQFLKSKQSTERKMSQSGIEASDDLLRAIKKKMLETKGRIDEAELRRRGYGDNIIARLKEL
jgi:hypothetical protein